MNDQTSNEETFATEQAVIAVNIAEYNATAAALAELRNKYKGVIFPVETAAGMKDALAARKELRDIRVGLEKLRKDIKEPALKRCQEIDSEAKTITKHLVELENPIDAQIKAEEARKEREKQERERIERERVAGIKSKIEAIRQIPVDMAGETAGTLADELEELNNFQPGEEFAEFADEAKAAVSTVIQTLTAMHDRQAEQEAESARLEKERAELERQRAERAEQERIAMEAREAEEARLRAEREAFEEERRRFEEERAAAQAKQQPAPSAQDVHDDSVDAGTDADDIVRELAGYTSMQFQALAKKVMAAGFDDLHRVLVDIAADLASGEADNFIKTANWMEMADADKEMALASHACVSIVCGDGEMGASVLRGMEA